MLRHFLLLILSVSLHYTVLGQSQQASADQIQTEAISTKYIEAVQKKSANAAASLNKQTDRYLAKLERQELRINKKLAKIDSLAAKNIFTNAPQQYGDIQNKVKNKSESLLQKGGQYMPWLDSAGSSLKFLESNPLTSQVTGQAAKIKSALSQVRELETQLKEAASVKDFIRQRKEYLKEQLQRYDLGKELKKYNQTAYYYTQQVNEYKEALSDPDKAERKALELLNKLPAFNEFMQRNSMLASLFNLPGGNDPSSIATSGNLIGLQTRASVQQVIQNQISVGGADAQALFQQNMQQAQGIISQLKNKIEQYGNSGSSDLDMPAYKPNTQKTKGFLKRIEYGANVQSVRSNYFFPVTTDLALSVGYRINDKSIIGIGTSYKMGWGKDIQHISISHQGIGFRSFIDMKLKGSFYASGGFEYNYQPITAPLSTQWRGDGGEAWQQSGLIGISKIVSLKTKYFKNTKLQLLWDVLSYQQVPRTQALKFRVGYSF